MRENRKIIILLSGGISMLVAAVFLAGTFVISSLAQDLRTVNTSGTSPSIADPGLESLVVGNELTKPNEPVDEKLLMKYEAPEVWLMVTSTAKTANGAPLYRNVRIELPDRAKEILAEHWRYSIDYYIKSELQTLPDVHSRVELDTARAVSIFGSKRELMLVQAEFPIGLRYISENESANLLKYVTLEASDLVNKAKDRR